MNTRVLLVALACLVSVTLLGWWVWGDGGGDAPAPGSTETPTATTTTEADVAGQPISTTPFVDGGADDEPKLAGADKNRRVTLNVELRDWRGALVGDEIALSWKTSSW